MNTNFSDGDYVIVKKGNKITAMGFNISKVTNKKGSIVPAGLLSQLIKKDISQITYVWTAKEAVFKAFKVNGIIFSDQIVVDPFEKNSTEGLARVFYKNQIFKFHLFFFKIRNYSCSVALSLQ